VRAYNDQDPETVLDAFSAERRARLQWLGNLAAPAWDNTHDHPLAGPLSARRILRNWQAHDLLHQRQLLQRRWWLLERDGPAGDLAYAGEW